MCDLVQENYSVIIGVDAEGNLRSFSHPFIVNINGDQWDRLSKGSEVTGCFFKALSALMKSEDKHDNLKEYDVPVGMQCFDISGGARIQLPMI